MHLRIPSLLLMVALGSACSVDLSKLRRPPSSSPDAGTPDATGSATPVVDGDIAAIPDLGVVSEASAPWDLQPSRDWEAERPDDAGVDSDHDVVAPAGMDAGGLDGERTTDTLIVGPDGEGAADTLIAGTDSEGTPDTPILDPDSGVADAGSDSTALDDAQVDATVDVDSAPAVDPDLVLWYKFDESSGTTAADSALWNGVARNATLAVLGTGLGAGASFTSASQVGSHAVSFTPTTSAFNAGGGYASLPSLQTLAPAALTIAVWVNTPTSWTSQAWARVFDLGTGTTAYMFLTVRTQDGVNAPARFAITKTGYSGEQRLDGLSGVGAGGWHHIAIVLQPGATYTGTMYIDGVAVGTNNSMTLHVSDLGATTNNWLGRSQWSGSVGKDPFLNGSLDDFRVYKRALSQQEIVALVSAE